MQRSHGTGILHPSFGLKAAGGWDQYSPTSCSITSQSCLENFTFFGALRPKAVTNRDSSGELLCRAGAALLCSLQSCKGHKETWCYVWRGPFCSISEKSSPCHHKGLRLFVWNNLELIHQEPFCTKDSHEPFLVAVMFVALKPFS